ncbi:hypothetical protein [Candidatus Uabimicrobium amorphum]|uniref:Uncharacterized protein n=1 Tax=Uabimicrobium amorphum TaxID=2596890 RepID=A0A5S9ILZ8_UABAM|nr:hypothetical protein [Candidatus Uabimicrobium amorphum]BBM83025.1 hypothetical protein UABAM_01368 [Candidatus Uabimicrobium amorphum]
MTGGVNDTKSVAYYQKLENFLLRFKKKIAPNHKVKSTGRFKMDDRYPEYKNEKSDNPPKTGIDVSNVVVNKKHDGEFVEKFKSFFSFLKRMFHKAE